MCSFVRPWSFIAVAAVIGILPNSLSSETRADEKEDALKAFSAFEGKWETGVTITKTKSGKFVGTNVDGETVFVVAWDGEAKKLKSVGFSSDHNDAAFVHAVIVLGDGRFRVESLYGNKGDLPLSVTIGADAFDVTNAKGEKSTIKLTK